MHRTDRRRVPAGRLSTPGLVVLTSAGLLGLCVALLLLPPPGGGAADPLLVYCAAGIKAPVEAAARRYEQETGVPVRLQLGPSQALFAQARVSRQGDLYLPGDDSYLAVARAAGLIGDAVPLARMAVVLAVRRGNPKGLRSLDGLLRPGVRLGQVDPDAAAAGKLVRDALRARGRWDAVKGATAVFKGTVTDVANDVRLGTIDAGFVWDVLVAQVEGLEAVDLPELAGVQAQVAVAVLTASRQPDAAARFAGYLAAPEAGQRWFREQGFKPAAAADCR